MNNLMFTSDAFIDACKAEDDFTEQNAFEQGAERFLSEFYLDAAENEFLDYSLREGVDLARDFWQFGQVRKVGETLISVKDGLRTDASREETLIQIITDDKVFLVDSVIPAISAFGVDVLGLFHPIVEGFRDDKGHWVQKGHSVSESMILVIIPKQSAQQYKEIRAALEATLQDVEIINQDFPALVDSVRNVAGELKKSSGESDFETTSEAIAFLDWVADGNFVLLGARRYDFTAGKDGSFDYASPVVDTKTALGVLRNPDVMVMRQTSEPSVIASNAQAFIERSEPVTVEKSNLFSNVHRRVRMDYISVKHYNEDRKVVAETRFVGLFTSGAYSRDPSYIPLIRRKIERVIKRSDYSPTSHSGKALAHVLSTYPRDELFQINEDELFRISTGVAQAYDRPRPRLFVRRDQFDRFVSVMTYVPREHYNSAVREKIGEHLRAAYNGRVSAFYPQYSDAPMARVHFIIGLNPGARATPHVLDLEAEIAALTQPWFDQVKALVEGEECAARLRDYERAFSPAYQSRFTAQECVSDIRECEALSDDTSIRIRVYRRESDAAGILRAKIYQLGERITPSRIMPILTNFDLIIDQETGYCVTPKGREVWIHDFEMHLDTQVDAAELASVFESAFMATWQGFNADDQFNSLILPLSASWRDIAFLRMVASYRRQSGMDPTESVQVEALATYPTLAQKLIDLMTTRFEPKAFKDMKKREAAVETLQAEITAGLDGVTSLDHDRVIRRMADVISATLRTNFYQMGENGVPKGYISIKIASRDVADLPAPVPYREIFVSGPMVEGVHLRFGPVARGGLRWSDRRDDFRTEVLGLVKAQQVKNSVIVPVGSKGGFFPKNLPVGGNREDRQAAAIEAYKTFISSLLDLTDNYKGAKTVPPKDVVCWDAPDPYLVVAADKGTATFSDIANGVSQSYGFWLDDAFASGGSVGYDHKAMGITARGAWEAVKRHFREIGKDIQTEEFTAMGCGDMSGDVFGNGMLLSEKTRLIAAFDHRDIFIDPAPDAATSYAERQRLFDLPRSSWQDYNTKLISKGGGVFPRSAKSVALSDEIKAMTGLKAESVTPDELIHALLKSETELLWFGGIGTYIKATSQSHAEVGDKANDNIRVNASEMKTLIVGEGANLGATQAGRIEFAQSGGRINTDAIDNSAGVDTSDNEVNIKILLGGAIDSGELKADKRNALLEEMTDEVAGLVLQHNYDQTGALSLSEMRARTDHEAYERLMVSLEADGLLDRTVETLPDTLAMREAAQEGGQPLTRPEISVLTAYVKNRLFDELISTDLADDSYTDDIVTAYFPKALQGFDKAIGSHRLRREIITSRITNKLVDVTGPLFMLRLQEQTEATPDSIARAFMIACETLNIDGLRADIAALDNQVEARAQLELQDEIMGVLRRVVAWLIRHEDLSSISAAAERRKTALAEIDTDWLTLLSAHGQERVQSRIARFETAGIPASLATDVALLRSRASGFDVTTLAAQAKWDIKPLAALYYAVGAHVKVDRIRSVITAAAPASQWEALAYLQLEEDFYGLQSDFTLNAAQWLGKKGQKHPSDNQVLNWFENFAQATETYLSVWESMAEQGEWTTAKLSILSSRLRDLLAKTTA